ncbi:MAG: hypothetical protein DYG94_03225 [Leptolyngbya sp. PLA3]|nr:MAG: hypothetical protein EDM82_11075 [Cyanobacteria bacterium CYA]MCE7967742.1 hypothetical protein [Leptolyngbya sp. PL-A3]
MSNSHAHPDAAYDQMDPHGFQGTHADHVIVDWRILLGVLLALLFLTALTTTFASLEQWAAGEFSIHIPHWINVVGALSIAVIKASLVCMFFMQLRYDKPLNTMVFLFCLLALGVFLGLTSLDLGGRGEVYGFKQGTISPGGDAQSVTLSLGAARVGPRYDTTMGKSMVEFARQRYIDRYNAMGVDGQAKWAEEMAHHLEGHGHGHSDADLPDANHSFTRVGVTPHLYDEHDPVAAGEKPAGESSSGGH